MVSAVLLRVLLLDTRHPWDYKKEFLPYLTDPIPDLLKKQNKQTGAFGDEPWICTDQNLIFPSPPPGRSRIRTTPGTTRTSC